MKILTLTTNSMPFTAFQDINWSRCLEWHKGPDAEGNDIWTLADWGTALAGEAGEACNITKKLRRIELGTELGPRNDGTVADLQEKLRKEIADVVMYAFLIASRQGFSLQDAVIDKFNEKSAEFGVPHNIVYMYGNDGNLVGETPLSDEHLGPEDIPIRIKKPKIKTRLEEYAERKNAADKILDDLIDLGNGTLGIPQPPGSHEEQKETGQTMSQLMKEHPEVFFVSTPLNKNKMFDEYFRQSVYGDKLGEPQFKGWAEAEEPEGDIIDPNKPNWLDRGLFLSPVHYCLVTNAELFEATLEHIETVDEEWIDGHATNATTNFYENVGPYNKKVAVVCLPIVEDRVHCQYYGLIAHEAVHIFQYVLSSIGETKPSPEFEAYCIQTIVQELIEDFDRQYDLHNTA